MGSPAWPHEKAQPGAIARQRENEKSQSPELCRSASDADHKVAPQALSCGMHGHDSRYIPARPQERAAWSDRVTVLPCVLLARCAPRLWLGDGYQPQALRPRPGWRPSLRVCGLGSRARQRSRSILSLRRNADQTRSVRANHPPAGAPPRPRHAPPWRRLERPK